MNSEKRAQAVPGDFRADLPPFPPFSDIFIFLEFSQALQMRRHSNFLQNFFEKTQDTSKIKKRTRRLQEDKHFLLHA